MLDLLKRHLVEAIGRRLRSLDPDAFDAGERAARARYDAAGDLHDDPAPREPTHGELIERVILMRSPDGRMLLEIESSDEPHRLWTARTFYRIAPLVAAQVGRALSIEAARAAVPSDDPEHSPPVPVAIDANAPTTQGKIDPTLGQVTSCGGCGTRWAWGNEGPPARCAVCDAALTHGNSTKLPPNVQ